MPSSYARSPFAYRGEFPPQMFNLAQYCLRAAQETPDRLALLVIEDVDAPPTEHWTYAQVERAILALAQELNSRGLSPGDRVLIRLDNRSEYAFLFFGAIAAGLIPLPASTELSSREIDFLIEDSAPALIALDESLPTGTLPKNISTLSQPDILDVIRSGPSGDYADTRADDPAFLVYTSGTTANPKGVLHAHRSIWGRRPMIEGWYALRETDQILHAGAFNWTYTLGTGLQDPWAAGATSVIFRGRKDPTVWPKLIEKHAITLFAAVPSLYRQILKYSELEKHDFSNFRHALTAGEALPTFVYEDWTERTGTPLYEALGMSEISTYISSSPNTPAKPGTVGKPQKERSVAILPLDGGTTPLPPETAGALAVHRSDPGLMLGYWNRPEEEDEVFRDEWFCGGDTAIIDEDGYVRHLGRKTDVMNAFGYRVSPHEIEEVLASHPEISEAAAAEVEVEPGVNIICGFCVAAHDTAPDQQSILDHLNSQLAKYKVPRALLFVDELPKTANGKVQRAKLPEIYAAPT